MKGECECHKQHGAGGEEKYEITSHEPMVMVGTNQKKKYVQKTLNRIHSVGDESVGLVNKTGGDWWKGSHETRNVARGCSETNYSKHAKGRYGCTVDHVQNTTGRRTRARYWRRKTNDIPAANSKHNAFVAEYSRSDDVPVMAKKELGNIFKEAKKNLRDMNEQVSLQKERRLAVVLGKIFRIFDEKGREENKGATKYLCGLSELKERDVKLYNWLVEYMKTARARLDTFGVNSVSQHLKILNQEHGAAIRGTSMNIDEKGKECEIQQNGVAHSLTNQCSAGTSLMNEKPETKTIGHSMESMQGDLRMRELLIQEKSAKLKSKIGWQKVDAEVDKMMTAERKHKKLKSELEAATSRSRVESRETELQHMRDKITKSDNNSKAPFWKPLEAIELWCSMA
jgi:hypothetical protein